MENILIGSLKPTVPKAGLSLTLPCVRTDDLQELPTPSFWETVKQLLMTVVYQFPETWT